jgi:coenzyme Q-binding protein COQ10
MPVFQAKRRVHHSADEMFDLVADVERYREFVPLCLGNSIRSRERRGQTEILITNMVVACGICRESFLSRVTLDRPNGYILVESTDGGHCANCIPSGRFFNAAFGRFVQAFERRADSVYGSRHVRISPRAISA